MPTLPVVTETRMKDLLDRYGLSICTYSRPLFEEELRVLIAGAIDQWQEENPPRIVVSGGGSRSADYHPQGVA